MNGSIRFIETSQPTQITFVVALTGTLYLRLVTRKPDFCLCENKGADQVRSNCEADQRLCFRYTDSTNPLLLKSEISVTVQASLCRTWSETPKIGFSRRGSFYFIREQCRNRRDSPFAARSPSTDPHRPPSVTGAEKERGPTGTRTQGISLTVRALYH